MDRQKSFFNKFEAFSTNQLLNAASVFRVMRKNNLSLDDFLIAMDAIVEGKRRQVQAEAMSRPTTGKPAQGRGNKPRQQAARQYPKTLDCPQCHAVAYAQPVCPGCAKGRAGIRREYICGECNFVFYID